MRVGRDLLRQILRAIVAAPHLRPAEEETLVAGQPANHRRFLAAERLLVGVISDGQAGEIADILTQREAAVELFARQHLIGVILRDERLARGFERRAVGRRPPVDRTSTLLTSSPYCASRMPSSP